MSRVGLGRGEGLPQQAGEEVEVDQQQPTIDGRRAHLEKVVATFAEALATDARAQISGALSRRQHPYPAV